MAPIRVFIFEDKWMCREAIVSVLGKGGRDRCYRRCRGSEDLHEGLDRSLKNPDVIFMDIRYHGEDLGIEALILQTNIGYLYDGYRVNRPVQQPKIVMFSDLAEKN